MGSTSKTPEFTVPPNNGKRLIPTTIDEVAALDPERVFASILKSPVSPQDGYRDITFCQIANGINQVAWLLEKELGRSQTFETLAYLAPGDLRYPIVAVAAVKVGYKMLFTSPRNSMPAHVSLFEKTNCTTMITTQPVIPPVAAILKSHSTKTLYLPSTAELLDGPACPPYPFTKTFEEASSEPFLVLHTSGSTGLPKPLTISHGYYAALDAMFWAGVANEGNFILKSLYNRRMFNTLPAFHAAGSGLGLCYGTFIGTVSVLPPPGPPPSAAAVIELLKVARADVAFLAPSTVEEISATPALLDQMSRMSEVFSSGGALPKAAGDIFRTKTKLTNCLGATEIAVLLTTDVDQEDWEYIAISPLSGVQFRHHSDDIYELIMVRKKELERCSPVWKTFPDLQEYSMKDLYTKHPSKPDLWRHAGRADDILVFSNGEKLNPISMEDCVQEHPDVRSALVVGEGRFQSALLIEPIANTLASTKEKAVMIESMWPIVQRANNDCPSHARISKSMILFTAPAKPMLRAGKGTVLRKMTLADYKAEIDALYTDAEVITNDEDFIPIGIHDLVAREIAVRGIVMDVTGWTDLETTEDFFQKGMDSLQALRLLGRLRASISGDELATSTIYRNPSVAKLCATLLSLYNQEQTNKSAIEQKRVQEVQTMLEKYTAILPPAPSRSKSNAADTPEVVVLTGSTGTLGSYLLDALLPLPTVKTIYCLSRSLDGKARQKQSNLERGLSTSWDPDRVHFLQWDPQKPNLGLPPSTYGTLTTTVTLILHNAWNVSFNLPLSAFEPQIHGVSSLIHLCSLATNEARIFFVSSVSAVANWRAAHDGPVPETAMHDSSVAGYMGYGESKHVAERLLEAASSTSGVPVTVCRVGQIAGPVVEGAKGVWPRQEWLPSMIKSSKTLGLLPETLGSRVDWIPVDVCSKVVLELALRGANSAEDGIGFDICHVVNPQETQWSDLLPVLIEYFGGNAKVVRLEAWTAALRKSSTRRDLDVETNPAVQLLGFWEGVSKEGSVPPPVLDTVGTTKQSKILAGLEPVTVDWMKGWLEQWRF